MDYHYIPVETPGGIIWAEVEEKDNTQGLVLTSIQDQAFKSFKDVATALKHNAQFLLGALKGLGPQEVEMSFGIKVGAEGGVSFFGLAKASGEANYTVTLKWKPDESPQKTSNDSEQTNKDELAQRAENE